MQNLIVDKLFDEASKIRVITLRCEDGGQLPPYKAGAHIDFDLAEMGTGSCSMIDWSTHSLGHFNFPIELFAGRIQRGERRIRLSCDTDIGPSRSINDTIGLVLRR